MGTGYSVLGMGLLLELRTAELGLVIVDFGIHRLEQPNFRVYFTGCCVKMKIKPK